MKEMILNNNDLSLAYELAGLYAQMDKDCRSVSNSDIQRLYGVAAKNRNIHYKALELNKAKFLSNKRKNGVR